MNCEYYHKVLEGFHNILDRLEVGDPTIGLIYRALDKIIASFVENCL